MQLRKLHTCENITTTRPIVALAGQAACHVKAIISILALVTHGTSDTHSALAISRTANKIKDNVQKLSDFENCIVQMLHRLSKHSQEFLLGSTFQRHKIVFFMAFVCLIGFDFWNLVSLCSPVWPGPHYVAQVCLKS